MKRVGEITHFAEVREARQERIRAVRDGRRNLQPIPDPGQENAGGWGRQWHLDEFAAYDRPVTKEFRADVLARYPTMKDGKHAALLRRMFLYICFSTVLDDATGLQRMGEHTVAALADQADNGRFVAATWIGLFEEEMGLKLNAEQRHWGHERTIDPEIPQEILARLDAEYRVRRRRKNREGCVLFVSGKPYGRRRAELAYEANKDYLDKLCDDEFGPSHPARALQEVLNGSSQIVLRKTVERNWGQMCDIADAMPSATEAQRKRKRYADRLIAHMMDYGVILRYGLSEVTPRLYARGVNPNMIPRELRKALFQDVHSLDLKAAQLAIVSVVYDCPHLRAFLSGGGDIWKELLAWIEMGEEKKQILKSTIYAVTFGMASKNYYNLLAYGYTEPLDILQHGEGGGIGREKAARFFKHPLIRELVRKRNLALQRIKETGCMEDAWGRTLRAVPDELGRPKATTLLACVAQSYEVRIMLGILPILQKHPESVEIVSFLHDGLYVSIKRKAEEPLRIAEIQEAIDSEARSLGIPTWLDM